MATDLLHDLRCKRYEPHAPIITFRHGQRCLVCKRTRTERRHGMLVVRWRSHFVPVPYGSGVQA